MLRKRSTDNIIQLFTVLFDVNNENINYDLQKAKCEQCSHTFLLFNVGYNSVSYNWIFDAFKRFILDRMPA